MGCKSAVEELAAPIVDVGAEILTGGGATPFLPLINAGVDTGVGLAQGESIGKAAGQGAIGGIETLGAQELAGAVGVGSGNSAFNDVLGITGDNPAGTGLPDIGGAINSGLNSVGNVLGISGPASADGAVSTNTAGASVNSSGATVAAPPITTSISTPGGGGPISAGQAIGAQDQNIDAILGTTTGSQPGLGSITPQIGGASESSIDSLSAPLSSAVTDATSGLSGVAPSGAASPSAPTSGGFVSSLENAAGRSAIPLGAAAFEAIKGPAKLPGNSAALAPGGAATAPLLSLETQGATEASTGQLTAPQQANVLQYVQDAQNQLIQQLTNEGVSNFKNDSRYIQGMQDIQQQALALQQQYITAAVNQATSAGDAASQNIATVANEQISNDKDFQDALAAAFAAIGGSSVPTRAAA